MIRLRVEVQAHQRDGVINLDVPGTPLDDHVGQRLSAAQPDRTVVAAGASYPGEIQ